MTDSPAKTWADEATRLANAAGRAAAEGDMDAFAALISKADQCLRLARSLRTMEMARSQDYSPGGCC